MASSLTRGLSSSHGRSVSPTLGGGGEGMPNLGIRFYEVKIPAVDAVVPVDYTADYRRFSYTDLKLGGADGMHGCSSIDPHDVSQWLLKVMIQLPWLCE